MKDVVIIEDNEGMGRLLVLKFERMNLSCILFENGMDASVYLRSNTPKLVVLDLMIPGATGWEILSEFSDLKFIIISARSRDEDIRRAFKFENVVDYVTKPLKLTLLMEKVDKFIKSIK